MDFIESTLLFRLYGKLFFLHVRNKYSSFKMDFDMSNIIDIVELKDKEEYKLDMIPSLTGLRIWNIFKLFKIDYILYFFFKKIILFFDYFLEK
jgi:hypothetical protein